MAAAVSFPSSDGMGRTLCPVDSMAPVSGVGGDDALVGPQGRGDHRGVDLGPAHQKVDGQILPAPAQGPDLGAGFVAKRIFSISNGLIEVRIRQPPQHAGVRPLGVVTFQSDHKSIPSEFES